MTLAAVAKKHGPCDADVVYIYNYYRRRKASMITQAAEALKAARTVRNAQGFAQKKGALAAQRVKQVDDSLRNLETMTLLPYHTEHDVKYSTIGLFLTTTRCILVAEALLHSLVLVRLRPKVGDRYCFRSSSWLHSLAVLTQLSYWHYLLLHTHYVLRIRIISSGKTSNGPTAFVVVRLEKQFDAISSQPR